MKINKLEDELKIVKKELDTKQQILHYLDID